MILRLHHLDCDLPSVSDATSTADRLTYIVKQRVIVEGSGSISCEASARHIRRPTETDVETILQQAEIASYRAKDEGADMFRSLRAAAPSANAKTRLAGNRRQAPDRFRRRTVSLVYQPQASLCNPRVDGDRGLRVRWPDPSLGLRRGDFIPAAERSRVDANAGASWVLNAALRQGKESARGCSGADAAPSPRRPSTRAPHSRDASRRPCSPASFPATRLELDISEATSPEATRSESCFLHHLCCLRVDFVIDNLGRGSTSPKHLRLVPVDRLEDRRRIC